MLTLENVSSLYNICEKSGVVFDEKRKRKLGELYDLVVERAIESEKKIAKLAETHDNKEIEKETEEEITL